ncbi:unnamed protein product, partial [Amoebophrya sp. A120]
ELAGGAAGGGGSSSSSSGKTSTQSCTTSTSTSHHEQKPPMITTSLREEKWAKLASLLLSRAQFSAHVIGQRRKKHFESLKQQRIRVPFSNKRIDRKRFNTIWKLALPLFAHKLVYPLAKNFTPVASVTESVTNVVNTVLIDPWTEVFCEILSPEWIKDQETGKAMESWEGENRVRGADARFSRTFSSWQKYV